MRRATAPALLGRQGTRAYHGRSVLACATLGEVFEYAISAPGLDVTRAKGEQPARAGRNEGGP
jgi:hypothetical protein